MPAHPTILLLNPNTSARTTAMMLAIARPHLPAGAVLRGMEATEGAPMILDPAALAIAAGEVVRIGQAEAPRVDAIIVAAFGDPGLAQLRTRVAIPVVGIGEAALHEAAFGGRRFAIITTTAGLADAMVAMVHENGLANGFTGLRIAPGDPVALAADPAALDSALAQAATACVDQDGAEAVVVGGGPLSEAAARLQARLHASLHASHACVIVEPVPASMRAALRALSKPPSQP